MTNTEPPEPPASPHDPDHDAEIAAPRRKTRPSAPSDWRDLLNRDYDYPDELLTGDMSRRRRRERRRAWRRADRHERAEWIRQQRRDQPPTSPAVILGAVAVMALVVFGAGYVVPRWFTDGEHADERDPVTLLTRPTPTSPRR